MLNLDKRSLLSEAWGTWNEVEIYDTKTSQEWSTYVEGENRKRKNTKRRNINCRRRRNWRQRKGSKEKDYGKGSSDEGLTCSFFKIIEYGVSWLRKLSEIPTGH